MTKFITLNDKNYEYVLHFSAWMRKKEFCEALQSNVNNPWRKVNWVLKVHVLYFPWSNDKMYPCVLIVTTKYILCWEITVIFFSDLFGLNLFLICTVNGERDGWLFCQQSEASFLEPRLIPADQCWHAARRSADHGMLDACFLHGSKVVNCTTRRMRPALKGKNCSFQIIGY